MELTNLLLNQLSNNNNSFSSKGSQGQEQGFTNILDIAKNSLNSKNTIEKIDNFKSDFKNNNVNKSIQNKKTFEVDSNKNIEKEQYNFNKNDIEDKKNVDNIENKEGKLQTDNNSKVNKTEDLKETEKNLKDKSKLNFEDKKVILLDQNLLDNISKLLNLDLNVLINSFANLNLSISDLSDLSNLTQFLQSSFNFNEVSELLSIDNLSSIIKDITNIANSIDYKDFAPDLKNVINIIENSELENVKILNFDSFNDILEQLNGEIVEFNSTSQNMDKINITPVNNFVVTEPNVESNNINLVSVQNIDTDELNIKVDNNKSVNDNINNLEHISNTENDFTINLENNTQSDGFEFEQNSETFLQNDENIQNIVEQKSELNPFSDNSKQLFKIDNINIPNKNDSQVKVELFAMDTTSTLETSETNFIPKTLNLKTVNPNDVINQVLEKMKTSVKPDMSEVKILLRPEHLGEVSLKVITQNGVVTAQFIAESQKVKEIIEANFNQLKDALNQQGIDIGSLEVNVSDENNQQFSQSNSFEQFENFSSKSSKRVQNILNSSVLSEQESEKETTKVSNSNVDYTI